MSGVMAPPYDVIPPGMQKDLYAASDYNVVRLILGKDEQGDGDTDNKYKRAGRLLREWQEKEILKRDDSECLYVYSQEYEIKGRKCRRLGFIGLLKIGDKGKDNLLPHEYTLTKPKEDRLNLIKEVRANLSPIFALYNDDTGEIRDILEGCAGAGTPEVEAISEGVKNELWRLSSDEGKNRIRSILSDRKLFIADGHHRYEVARTYRDIRRKEAGYDGSADHVMVYFTDMADSENLTVLATHRAVRSVSPTKRDDIEGKLRTYFDVTPCGDLEELTGLLGRSGKDHCFGVVLADGLYFLTPKDVRALEELIGQDKSPQWKKLDVSVLHSAVLEKILSIKSVEGNITYLRDAEDAVSLVTDEKYDVAFILNPTPVWQLRDVAELGEMMPQKSTYFYPKLLTGLVINKF